MSSIVDAVRRRAYELWEQAGMPEGRSDEFWHAAAAELHAPETIKEKVDALGPPIVEPPEVAVQHGAPVGRPGERIVEQGDTLDVLHAPTHPYTQALLASSMMQPEPQLNEKIA